MGQAKAMWRVCRRVWARVGEYDVWPGFFGLVQSSSWTWAKLGGLTMHLLLRKRNERKKRRKNVTVDCSSTYDS